jgi:hypothetical protein
MHATIGLAEQLGARAACAGLGVSRASLYHACQVRLPSTRCVGPVARRWP